jgi:hypothetical protein
VCPDSNIILERVLGGNRFKNQISFFCDRSKKAQTTTIILPKVHREIGEVVSSSAGFFVDAVNQYRKLLRANLGKSLDQVKVESQLLAEISPLNGQIQRFLGSTSSDARRQRVQQAVIEVETALVRRVYEVANGGRSVSQVNLDSILKDLGAQMGKTYSAYTDTYASTTREIGAIRLPPDAYHQSGDLVDQMLSNDCGVENNTDREILAQAICVMFTSNLWTALVTNDRGDMLSNRKKIEEKSLLTVSNPLYVFENVLNRARSEVTPIQAAIEKSVEYTRLVRLPSLPTNIV